MNQEPEVKPIRALAYTHKGRIIHVAIDSLDIMAPIFEISSGKIEVMITPLSKPEVGEPTKIMENKTPEAPNKVEAASSTTFLKEAISILEEPIDWHERYEHVYNLYAMERDHRFLLESQLEKALDALKLVPQMMGHEHWDNTMQHGIGCPICIRQREILEQIKSLTSPKRAQVTHDGLESSEFQKIIKAYPLDDDIESSGHPKSSSVKSLNPLQGYEYVLRGKEIFCDYTDGTGYLFAQCQYEEDAKMIFNLIWKSHKNRKIRL